MKRRDFCKLLGLSAAGGVILPALPASAAAAAAGRAVPDGNYSIPFLSMLTETDTAHDFYYSESFFDHSAAEYDHQLALATLGMAMAAFNAAAGNDRYWVNGDIGRQDNIAAAYELLGFSDPVFYNYDLDVGKAGDFVGYSLARKTFTRNGRKRTLVALMLRGGGYGGEWTSNFHLGSTSAHYGFTTPVAAVFASLKAYLSRITSPGELKLWVGGYSRGAAIANLTAAKALNTLSQLKKENVFVYTFATPAALTADDQLDMQMDFDNNHDADGALRADWAESSFFNILSSGDIVTRVLPGEWGYFRNGNDRFLPATKNRFELQYLNELSASYGPDPLDFTTLADAEDTNALVETMVKFFGSKEQFHEKYEAAFMDMMQCAFTRTEDEVTYGKILSDEEIIFRLQSLSNMHQFDFWQIARSVWAASKMSRPILERYGQNVPLRAKQILIPVLAVGLCYGVEADVVRVMAQYIIKLVSIRGEPDSVLRSAYCHYGENYLALMEYYSPEDHGLQPFTRLE